MKSLELAFAAYDLTYKYPIKALSTIIINCLTRKDAPFKMVSPHRAIVHFFLAMALLTGFASLAHADLLQNQFAVTVPPRTVTVSFEDSQGNSVSLADFRGKYVLLNLWATWCGPCVREMPALDRLRTHFHPKQLQIIALIEDHDGNAAAKAFYTRHNLTHLPIFVDSSGHAPSLLHIQGLPTTLLIDPEGREIGRVEGDAEWDSPDALAFIQNKINP